MEIIETKNLSTLRVKLDMGMENGKIKTKTKSFTFLRHDAQNSDIYEVAIALMGLQNHGIIDVSKQDNTTLSL